MPLSPIQAAFLDSNALLRGFVGGIGSGKSFIGSYDLLRNARRGSVALAAAPTYPMLRDATLRSFFYVTSLLGIPVRFNKSEHLATLPNGAEILFRSADEPERLRGPNLARAWLDEASLMHRDVLTVLLGRLRQGGSMGQLSATFTPKGLGHWTYEVFGTGRADTEIFHARTLDNPFLPADFHDKLTALYGGAESGLSRQELGGEFLDDETGWQVIPHSWLRAAQRRWTPTPPADQPLTCLGVDVAYGGADATIVSARYGPWFAPLKSYRGEVTDSGQKAAFLVLQEHDGAALIHVDGIGYGAACHEHLRERVGKLAVAVNVASAPLPEAYDRSGKYRLTNTRALAYWLLREALDPETGDGLALPPDPELLADLTAPTFEVRASGIVVESKEKIKERLGRSPDRGDAVALAHLRPQKREFHFLA